MIVNYFEPVLNFSLPPEQAIAYFSQKGLKPTFSYKDMLGAEHDRAFTVAKMMDVDLLSDVKQAMQDAIKNGESLQTFKKNLTPVLENAGWWGKKEITNPDGFKQTVQLGSSRRLETIYRTNMQSAYAAGQWDAIQEQKEFMPYLMYDAVDDSKTRQSHAVLDNTVRPIDDAFWNTAYPPNGYNCRCGVIQMDSDMLEQYGLNITKSNDIPFKNGLVEGVDPGFNHNAGIGYQQILSDIQNAKIDKLPVDTKTSAKKGVKNTQTLAAKKKQATMNIEAEKLAQEQLAKAKALENAQAQLNDIKQGKASKQPGIKKNLLNKYIKNGTAAKILDDKGPLALLEKIVSEAQAQQNKKEIASAMSGYKKKVLADKLPTKKQQEVFDSLPELQKIKVLSDITKAKLAKQSQVDPISPVYSLDMRNMKQLSGQTGSNPGGLYYDEETGIKWYIKKPPTDDHARNEVLTAKLYEAAGVEVPNVQIIKDSDGNLRVASQIIDGLSSDSKSLKAGSVKNVNEGFVVDAWLANWDVVGLSYDNMLIKQNRAIRLDTGGGLLFRAQGARKGDLFGNTVDELATLRNPNINPQAARVFAKVTQQELSDAAKKLNAISEQDIKNIIDKHGPGTESEKNALYKKLLARRADIVKKTAIDKFNEQQYKLAKNNIEDKLRETLQDIDFALVKTLKGINFNFAKEGIRQVDKERYAEFLDKLNGIYASGKLSNKSVQYIKANYQPWIDELSDAINNNKPLSGNIYNGFAGAVNASEDAIRQLAESFGDLPPTSASQAKKIITQYAGDSAANFKIYKTGDEDLQNAFSKLTLEHKRAISMYTGSYYRNLNRSLYGRTGDAKTKAFKNLLNEALEYSDDYVGLSARGFSKDDPVLFKRFVQGHLKAFKESKPFRYLGFTSSTMGDSPAFGGEVKILIQGKTGTWVNPISANAGRENEVLFRADTTFMVTKFVDHNNGRYTIYIKEIDAVEIDPDLEFIECHPY